MRILIDVLHPAHVHFFRAFRDEMERRGHEVGVTSREKEMTTDLLDSYRIDHTVLSRQARRKPGLAVELVVRTTRLIRYARRFRPDVLTGIMGPSIALAGRTLGTPSVVFYDTEHARHTNFFVYPLAHTVCTPTCYEAPVRGRHVTYPGYHELAYLHPRRFTPNPSRLAEFGLTHQEPYFVVRFVSWQSIHDLGDRGLPRDVKLEIVHRLERRGRVVVSSEGEVPDRLEDKLLQGPAAEIHHVLAHARGIVAESATMCSEAAVLGVPSLYVNPVSRGYLREQEERYGLVRNVNPDDSREVLSALEHLPWEGTTAGRRRLLTDNVDVTDWMVRFLEEEFGG